MTTGAPRQFPNPHRRAEARAICAFLLTGCGAGSASAPTSYDPAPVARERAARTSDLKRFARVEGARFLAPDGRPLLLRGMAFGNRVWQDVRIPREHHDERDYARLAALGMNSVRFYMHYRTFESDEAPGQWLSDGFRWLDDNVAWAKKHGIFLVLNLHVPPGGFQSLGAGKALWREPALQARFIALWRAIAERYAREPTIVGYDLLNEPVVERGLEEWQSLAERTIAAIRQVDPNHALFVERVNAVAGDWSENANRNFVRVSDPNVVYEFHFYKPFNFTHQSAPWVDFAPVNIRYPDAKAVEVEWFHLKLETGSFNSPKLPPGSTPWRYYKGQSITVSDARMVVGKPSLACSRVGRGRAFFDDVVLERVDAAGRVVEELWRVNLDTPRGWYFWQQSGKGERALVTSGHGDASALSITGTSDEANLGADYLRFAPTPGATYRLSGWMRGENIPREAKCQLRLDLFSSKLPVQRSDRAYLEQELDAYLAWGAREKVPLYLGELGTIRFAFENDRGGERWVADMLDLLRERQLGFAYHDYHEAYMGLFYGDDALPDPKRANDALLRVLTDKLGASRARERAAAAAE